MKMAQCGSSALQGHVRIRQRPGGEPSRTAPFPQKPPGMRHRTYERLPNQAFDAEMLAGEAFAIQNMRLLERLSTSKEFWS
jgi:hypothetical protein